MLEYWYNEARKKAVLKELQRRTEAGKDTHERVEAFKRKCILKTYYGEKK